ncbi:helix-turn-helix transcriptional regulator [Paenibacillus thiaminolyticus]|uniref:helix-turn-helix domain-containing protein n=1 Tax=Paenibacillus TaxID=44249 RepID=UPI001059F467|nr:helix-turn-helix transcriptional regulator [Paenibacillus dendritiformis]TDL49727.1 XRE family transcriptional regulator [Paenibacillus dendritiformis]
MEHSSTSKIIGNNIRQRRKLKGLTQEQLAELVGTNFSYIGKMERGQHNLKVQTLEKIAEALDVSMSAPAVCRCI